MMGAALGLLLVLLYASAVAYATLTTDLPSLSNIRNYAPFQTAQIFDRHGTLLWSFTNPDGG
jgi:membrane carboxypeptidase/penicillin-binding protein